MAPPSFSLPSTLFARAPSSADASAPTSSPPPSATNHLAIQHRHTPIRGTYTIDTSIVVPPLLLDPVPNTLWTVLADALTGGEAAARERERPNAAFSTEFEQIDLVLHVRGGGRAHIRVEKKYGGDAVRVAIASLAPDTSLSLTVTSPSTVSISLPSNFRGLVKGGSERGSLKFSPGLTQQTATFSVDQQNPMGGRYFIGDWQQAVEASGQAGESAAQWSAATSATGAEERKGPLLLAEVVPESYESNSSSTSFCGTYPSSSSSAAAASSSTSVPAPAPFQGDVITVTSEHGNVTLETMEERAERIERSDRSWQASVASAMGGCCGATGALFLACFGCPEH
ncbi:hypothetical protein RQP46_000597 [Phenoliferia psychrophenolica]